MFVKSHKFVRFRKMFCDIAKCCAKFVSSVNNCVQAISKTKRKTGDNVKPLNKEAKEGLGIVVDLYN